MPSFMDSDGVTKLCNLIKSKFDEALSAKQDTLVSGTSIKTLNGNSLLGSGNLYFPANTDTKAYKICVQDATLPATDSCGRQRIVFTSADGLKLVPMNASSSTSTSTSKTLNTRPIDIFGPIMYCEDPLTANLRPSPSKLWLQNIFHIGYSYVKSLTSYAPVYLKCTPQSDCSAVMADIVQALPSTNDGYIYIFLGTAYSSSYMELLMRHPVYYHDGTGIKVWTGNTKYSISNLGGTGTNYFWANKGCATLMSSGTTPSAQWGSASVCTIPNGYRPPTPIYLPVQKDGAIASDTYLIISDDGSVTIQNSGGTQAAVTYRVTATYAYY